MLLCNKYMYLTSREAMSKEQVNKPLHSLVQLVYIYTHTCIHTAHLLGVPEGMEGTAYLHWVVCLGDSRVGK